jgi:4-amino-4-deoxy-L-arabinose transferase-like glycosyltransferase
MAYLTIPSVAFGGLEKAPVRLPNAIAGVLAIVVVYFLVKKLIEELGGTQFQLNPKAIALISAFLLAISPWHVMMSRGAFEANLTTLFLPLGLLLLVLGLKKPKYLYLGAIILGINMFTYHAAKLVTPGAVVLFGLLFGKRYLSLQKKHLLLAGTMFSIFIAATLYSFAIGAGARVGDVSIFKGIVDASAEYKMNAYSMGVNPGLARVIYSKFGIIISRFLENYVSYFSPQYLFTKGPSEATYGMIPGRGVLYLFELPFIFGCLASLQKAKDKRIYLFILGWLLLAPVPASLTTGAGYAGNRSETMLPVLQIILAIGAYQIFVDLGSRLNRRMMVNITSLYAVFSFMLFAGFLADYFLISPARNATAMLSGDLEVATALKEIAPEGSRIVVSKSLSEPQIYIAFANKWDPSLYQSETKNWNYEKLKLNWVDQLPSYSLGNYTFKGINMDDYRGGSDMDIIVGKPGEFPNDVKTSEIIYQPDGTAAVFIVKASDLTGIPK